MQKAISVFEFIRRQPRWRWFVVAAVLAGAGLLLWSGGSKSAAGSPVFAARRGPLEITVLEGGSLQALESQEIKCEVRVGYQGTKILKIVEEGYFVTEDDVKTNKVLVELDGSDLQKQIVQQEISYQSALASLIDAQQNYEIQLNQNSSDIKAAEQKARFARMDFDKFLGDTVTEQIVQQTGLDRLLEAAGTNNLELPNLAEGLDREQPPPSGPLGTNGQAATARATEPHGTDLIQESLSQPPGVTTSNGSPSHEAAAVAEPAGAKTNRAAGAPRASTGTDGSGFAEAGLTNSIRVDFTPYADIDKLGDGEAKQKLRKFQDDLQVAQKELGQAKMTLEGTQRLFAKDFVTKTDLQRDEIAFENSRLKVQTAESARDLFLKYDFVKSAEESLSKYAEAVRDLDKARRLAISKLAQARAKLKSAEGQHQIQLRQRNDLNEQLEKCTLRAKKSGLVVYGAAGEDMFYYGGEERIREGATVRERQAIITIPDMSRMVVKVKIHESYIKKVQKGQKARITVDAFPDKVLSGEVTKVGVLPDSQNRWMNPDLKVYLTTITINGTQDWIKPGMSAKVEILVNKIEDCIYVPVQAVSPDNEKQVCYVASGLKQERREVQVGEFNDEFMEIRSGLKQGERVLLRRPAGAERGPTESERKAPAAAPDPTSMPAAAPVQARKT